MREDSGTADGGVPRGRSELPGRALHLCALCAFAVAQPLFDVLQRDAAFFVARRSEPIDLVALALGLALLPPAVAIGLELVAGRIRPSFGRALHHVLIGTLAGLVVLPPLNRVSETGAVWPLPIALAAGVASAALYARWSPARTFLSLLSPAGLLFAALFLTRPSIAPIVTPADAGVPGSGPVDSTTSAVVLVFDELPVTSLMNAQRQVDGALFPNFARLAAGSTWFRNATTPHFQSVHAVPAIMTGKAPTGERQLELGRRLLPIAADHPQSLFTLLGGSYRVRAHESLTAVCPEHLGGTGEKARNLGERLRSLSNDLALVYAHMILPETLASDLPSVTTSWGEFGPDETDAPAGGGKRSVRHRKKDRDRTRIVRDFGARIDNDEAPTLYFLHVMLPHTPWSLLPSGAEYPALDPFPGQARLRWNDDPGPTALAYQQHLLQLGFLDVLLGELLDRLQAVGVYERSLVVVTADHGISFRSGTFRRKASGGNERDIMHVPLFVKLPFQDEARVDDRNAELLDVVPTVANALGVELPWPVDGTSLLGEAPSSPGEKTVYSAQEALVRDGTFPASLPALDRKLELFGTDADWESVHAFGQSDLVGLRVSEIEAAEATDLVVHFERDWPREPVDASSGIVPACVLGRVVAGGDASIPPRVAVAVDGTIRAVALPFDADGDRARFAAMVPADALSDGIHHVEAFALRDGAPPARIPSHTFELEIEAGEPHRIVRSDGESFTIVRGALDGRVAGAELDGGVLELSGWAADLERAQPAQTIVLFLEGSGFACAGTTGERSAYLADEDGGEELASSGFRLRFPIRDRSGVAARARVFAVAGRVASELEFGKQAKWLELD